MSNLIHSIDKLLIHDYPFIFVDQYENLQKGESLVVIKNITGTEWIFKNQTSFQQNKFPETLLIEVAAQAAFLLYKLSDFILDTKDKLVLNKIKASFYKEAVVGDIVVIKVIATKMLEKFGIIDICLSIDDENISNIQIMYSKVYGK